jgi:hypothetical protein
MNHAPKPLAAKLGFMPGDEIFVETTPDWYSRFADENGLELTPGLPATHAHIFCNSKAALIDFLENNDLGEIEKSLWVSWPKRSSGVRTDAVERIFRDAILPLGWVDVKVAAIDEAWSGLKFLRRQS